MDYSFSNALCMTPAQLRCFYANEAKVNPIRAAKLYATLAKKTVDELQAIVETAYAEGQAVAYHVARGHMAMKGYEICVSA